MECNFAQMSGTGLEFECAVMYNTTASKLQAVDLLVKKMHVHMYVYLALRHKETYIHTHIHTYNYTSYSISHLFTYLPTYLHTLLYFALLYFASKPGRIKTPCIELIGTILYYTHWHISPINHHPVTHSLVSSHSIHPSPARDETKRAIYPEKLIAHSATRV